MKCLINFKWSQLWQNRELFIEFRQRNASRPIETYKVTQRSRQVCVLATRSAIWIQMLFLRSERVILIMQIFEVIALNVNILSQKLRLQISLSRSTGRDYMPQG